MKNIIQYTLKRGYFYSISDQRQFYGYIVYD